MTRQSSYRDCCASISGDKKAAAATGQSSALTRDIWTAFATVSELLLVKENFQSNQFCPPSLQVLAGIAPGPWLPWCGYDSGYEIFSLADHLLSAVMSPDLEHRHKSRISKPHVQLNINISSQNIRPSLLERGESPFLVTRTTCPRQEVTCSPKLSCCQGNGSPRLLQERLLLYNTIHISSPSLRVIGLILGPRGTECRLVSKFKPPYFSIVTENNLLVLPGYILDGNGMRCQERKLYSNWYTRCYLK